MNVKRFFKQFVTLPDSPSGRKMRIEQLMESTGAERDICAAIVYARDVLLNRPFSDEEAKDAGRIRVRLENGEITLLADREGGTQCQ
jgi:hypothetical protein